MSYLPSRLEAMAMRSWSGGAADGVGTEVAVGKGVEVMPEVGEGAGAGVGVESVVTVASGTGVGA
jgi:hypothetical protein